MSGESIRARSKNVKYFLVSSCLHIFNRANFKTSLYYPSFLFAAFFNSRKSHDSHQNAKRNIIADRNTNGISV